MQPAVFRDRNRRDRERLRENRESPATEKRAHRKRRRVKNRRWRSGFRDEDDRRKHRGGRSNKDLQHDDRQESRLGQFETIVKIERYKEYDMDGILPRSYNTVNKRR